MKATIDANILFSALLKKGMTRKILFGPEMNLCAPKFLLIEFLKYKKYLKSKFGGTEEEFEALLQKIISQIRFVPDEELKPYLPAARTLAEDPKDWLYLACALKEDTIIWSNDRGLKKQGRIRVFTTHEMKKEFGNL
jgi:predicted nucleic acid-binding protein